MRIVNMNGRRKGQFLHSLLPLIRHGAIYAPSVSHCEGAITILGNLVDQPFEGIPRVLPTTANGALPQKSKTFLHEQLNLNNTTSFASPLTFYWQWQLRKTLLPFFPATFVVYNPLCIPSFFFFFLLNVHINAHLPWIKIFVSLQLWFTYSFFQIK